MTELAPWEGPDEMLKGKHEELPIGRLGTPDAVKDFVLAGNAHLTLVSEKTGTRYTFKVSSPKGKTSPHFVSVLYGDDNSGDYVFFGTIFDQGEFRHGRRSVLQPDDKRVRGWRFMWSTILTNRMPADMEIWHEGRCGRCGRMLTVPESIERGIGPECANKMGAM